MTRTRPIDAESLKRHFVTDTPLIAYDIVRGVNIMIDNQPTLDVVPVRHGHWIKEFENEDGRNLRCSECRTVFYVGKGRDGNYCPNCGCRMDEK